MRRIAIGQRPSRRHQLPSWYSSLLEQQAASGLGVTEFAAQTGGVSAASLYGWRRRLAPAVTTEPMTPAAAKLIEVTLVEREPTTEMVVQLDDGRRRIVVSSGFDADDLRRLVAVLESC